MNSRAFRGAPCAVAAFSASAIVLAGCAGGGGDAPSADSDEPITLTLATFNDFGYTDELLQEYMDENPNIKIVHNKAADLARRPRQLLRRSSARKASPTSRPSRSTGSPRRCSTPTCSPRCPTAPRAAGSTGRKPPRPTPTAASSASAPTSARRRSATAPTCSRPPACPPTPDEVAALFDGDWDNFFDVADQYKAATGKPMIDSAHSVFQGMVNQIEFPYDEPDGTVVATDNPELEDGVQRRRRARRPELGIRRPVDRRLERLDGQRRVRRDAVPRRGCSASSRATRPTSPAGTSPTRSPNGGGNWGGSYLTVPANGKNVEAALALADWLTAPEQQVKAFVEAGHVPEPDRGAERPGDRGLRRTRTSTTRRPVRSSPTVPRRSRSHRTRARLLQVPPGAPGCRHPRLRRTRRPADRVGHLRGRGRSLLTTELSWSGGRASPRGPHSSFPSLGR